MTPEVSISLRPRYSVAVSLAAPGGVLVLKPPQDTLLAELQAVMRGPKGDAGSSLESYIAEIALSGHVALTLNGAGQAIAADCRSAAHAATVLGVSTGAASAGSAITVRAIGKLESPGWGLTPGLPVYLGESGALGQAVPSSALFIKQIGHAISSAAVLIDLQPAIFLT